MLKKMIKRKEKKTIVHMRVQYIYFSNFFKRKNFFEFEISRRKKKKKILSLQEKGNRKVCNLKVDQRFPPKIPTRTTLDEKICSGLHSPLDHSLPCN